MSLSAEEERAFAQIGAPLRTDPRFAQAPRAYLADPSAGDRRRGGWGTCAAAVAASLTVLALLAGAHPAAVMAAGLATAVIVGVTVLSTGHLTEVVARWRIQLRWRHRWRRDRRQRDH